VGRRWRLGQPLGSGARAALCFTGVVLPLPLPPEEVELRLELPELLPAASAADARSPPADASCPPAGSTTPASSVPAPVAFTLGSPFSPRSLSLVSLALALVPRPLAGRESVGGFSRCNKGVRGTEVCLWEQRVGAVLQRRGGAVLGARRRC